MKLSFVSKHKKNSVSSKNLGLILVNRNIFGYEGLMYRNQTYDCHSLVVPKTLIHDAIKENHDPVYVAHPGVKTT
jgi:hypothetical protein